MGCDLHRIFSEILVRLPKDGRSHPLRFSSDSSIDCPERLETDQLVLVKSGHEYGSGYRTDLIRFYAKKETFQELGLLILAIVFRPGGGRTHVVLNHPRSVVKNLVISYEGLTPRSSGHKTKPDHLCFLPERIEKYPWKGWGTQFWPLSSFPCFTLTNINQFVATEDDWAARDTVMGFGTDDANIRLADLLLNIGYSDQTEFVLEGEGGNRGIGINSAEAVFYVCKDLESEFD
jgi:hypothetical protein